MGVKGIGPRIFFHHTNTGGGGGVGGVNAIVMSHASRIQSASGARFWFDDITTPGHLREMIRRDQISGVTTNPAILSAAVAKGTYDHLIIDLISAGRSNEEIAYAVNAQAIKELADVLMPVFDEAEGGTGFASIEVDPRLANETAPQVKQGLELFRSIDLPNIMIKIPATRAGAGAIEGLTAAGINVNATLIFSEEHYLAVAEAYINGLLAAWDAGRPLKDTHSVASFFVSRFDAAIDPKLSDPELQGSAAVAQAKRIYQLYRTIFFGVDRMAAGRSKVGQLSDWFALMRNKHEANVQTLLLASTSTKNPAYHPAKYVLEILGPHTINTLPPKTLEVVRTINDYETPSLIGVDTDKAVAHLQALKEMGVDVNLIGEELQLAGANDFVAKYEQLLAAIESKRN